MSFTHSPMITPLPRRDGAQSSTSTDQNRIAELRAELAGLTATMSEFAAKRAADTTASLRQTIEERPWLSLGAAAAAGAALALALVPKRSRGFRYDDYSSYNAGDITASVRRAAARAGAQPLTSRLERLADAIGSIDTTAVASSPAFDAAKTWVQSLVNGVRKS